MRFRVPSLFLSLYLGYNNLANLYMIYIHRILVIFFCLFFSTVSAQKVGLVLSGGGAKGLTHIGIIRALEENNIPIDYVTGTSMGAIIGSLYAMGYSPDDMEKLIRSEDFKRWYSGGIQEKYIYYFKTSRIKITAKEEIAWTLDGEDGGKHQDVEILNLRQAVQIMVRKQKK